METVLACPRSESSACGLCSVNNAAFPQVVKVSAGEVRDVNAISRQVWPSFEIRA